MILIIDDDAAVRSSLTFLLKRAGFEPEAVPGPEEALVIVRREAPQLILMDMNFTLTTTGEEGIQLLKQPDLLPIPYYAYVSYVCSFSLLPNRHFYPADRILYLK